MTAEVLQPQALTATVGYHLEPERGGDKDWCPGTVGDKRRKHDHQDVTITNFRGRENEFSLDKQGFQIGSFTTTASATDFDEAEKIKGQYYRDVATHVQQV